MKELNIKDNWNHIRARLKEKYPSLDDDDLKFTEGQEDIFIGRLQRRLGGAKREEIIDMIKKL